MSLTPLPDDHSLSSVNQFLPLDNHLLSSVNLTIDNCLLVASHNIYLHMHKPYKEHVKLPAHTCHTSVHQMICLILCTLSLVKIRFVLTQEHLSTYQHLPPRFKLTLTITLFTH